MNIEMFKQISLTRVSAIFVYGQWTEDEQGDVNLCDLAHNECENEQGGVNLYDLAHNECENEQGDVILCNLAHKKATCLLKRQVVHDITINMI